MPHPAEALSDSDWQAKVDPWVLETSAQGDTEFLIFLTEQADVSGAAQPADQARKGQLCARKVE